MNIYQHAQEQIREAHEATKKVSQKRHEEAAENQRAFERFYSAIALFSGGTIALSVTFLGFLKSASQPVHLRLLFASWFCLFICLVTATFYTFFNTCYRGYARSAEYVRKLKEQKETVAEKVPFLNVANITNKEELDAYIKELKSEAANLQEDLAWNGRREKLHTRLYRACGITANITFVLGIALLLVFATINLSAPVKKETPGTSLNAIRQLTGKSLASWDNGDTAGIANYWAEDGDLIDGSGNETRGRAAIEGRFVDMLRGTYKDSHLAYQVWSIRFLKPDVAVVDGYFEIENRLDASGKRLPPEKVLFTDVLLESNNKWEAKCRRETGVSQFPSRFLITPRP